MGTSLASSLDTTTLRRKAAIASLMLFILIGMVSLVSCQAQAAPLSVELVATPCSGPAPLKVSFSATPVGGTLPYEPPVLNLGDGAIISIPTGEVYTHTYSKPKKYVATVNVIDSEGSKANDSVTINALVARFVPGEVIVGYANDEVVGELKDLIPELGGKIIRENKAGRFILVRVEEGYEETFIKLILQKAEGMVTYAELNYLAEAKVK